MKTRFVFCALAAFALHAAPAHAQVALLGNFASPASGVTQQFASPSIYSVRFTTGAQPVTVSQAQASLGTLSGTGATMNFGIYSDRLANPSVLLFSLGSQFISTEGATPDVTFTGTGSFLLTANTTYHLRGNVTGTASVLWARTQTVGATPTAQNGSGIVFNSYRSSPDNGATYSDFAGFPLRVNILGAIVPESGTFALLLPALALLGAAVARRSRRAA